MKISRQAGFSLLEAVVAMVLISGVGYALFGWINTNIMTLTRIQETNARAEVTQNILEYMNSINPMKTPAGNARLGQVSLRWESKPITLVQDGLGLYQLALYDTLVRVDSRESLPGFEFHFRQVGHKKVRELPTQ